MVIFVFAASVAIAAMLVTEPLSYVPTESFIWGSLMAGFLLLALFALACGCVVGPRLGIPSPIELTGNEADLQYLAGILQSGHVRVAKDGDRYYMAAIEMDNSPACSAGY